MPKEGARKNAISRSELEYLFKSRSFLLTGFDTRDWVLELGAFCNLPECRLTR